MLFKKLLRELKLMKIQFILVTLLIVIGVLLYTGLKSVSLNGMSAIDEYYKENNLADLWINVNTYFEDSIIKRIENIKEVKEVFPRITLEGKTDLNNIKDIDIRVHTISSNQNINKLRIEEGSSLARTDLYSCFIHQRLSKAYNLKVNDTIDIKIKDISYRFKIIGIVNNPEYTYEIKDADNLLPDYSKFGIIYVNENLFLKDNIKYNELCVDLYDTNDSEVAKRKIEDLFNKHSFTFVTTRKENMIYELTNMEFSQMSALADAFPLIFFFVAAVVTYLTISRLIESQGTIIGTLKALGIYNHTIIMQYIGYAILIGLSGGIIGAYIGVYFMPELFINLYERYYTIPTMEPRIHLSLVIPAITYASIFPIISVIIACRKILRQSPLQAMRPKVPKVKHTTNLEQKLENIFGVTENNKLIIRNMFRSKTRILLSILGIIGSISVTIVAFGISDSVNHLIDMQYNKILKYDIKADLVGNKNVGIRLNAESNIDKVETIMEAGIEITNNGYTENTIMTVLNKDSSLINMIDINKNKLDLSSGTYAYMSKILADKLNVVPGDIIDIKIFPSDRVYKMEVGKVITLYMGQGLYVSKDYLDSIKTDLYKPTSILIKTILGKESIIKEMLDNKYNELDNIKLKTELFESFTESLDIMDVMISIMIICSCILSLTVIINLTNINIHERKRDLAILRVLGFHISEIRSLIVMENIYITLLSLIPGVLLGRILYYTVIDSIAGSMESMYFEAIISKNSIIISLFITIIFTIFSNILVRNKFKQIGMIESLKNVE